MSMADAWSVAARAAIGVPLAVMESMRNYTDRADVIYAWRDRMADLIEAELARVASSGLKPEKGSAK